MKRKILALLLVFAMTTLAACGNSNSSGGQTAGGETEENGQTDAPEEPEADVADGDDGTEASGDGQSAKKIKILSIWAEDTDNGKLITDITNRYIEEINPNFEYEYELVSTDNLEQKISTLLASNDLPDVFVYESGARLKTLIEADKVLDVGEALNTLGVYDILDEGAVSLLKTLSGTNELYDLPLGMNVEGFWYNKALFEQAGVEVPTTWEEFEGVLSALNDAGIQPLTAGGADKWPLTRLVNAYAVRSMGPEVMRKAAAGEIRYTDEGLVAAAQKLQNWAEAGYFGQGMTTVDMTTAGDMLLSGKAAMFYNGSWFTENLVADTNPAGEDGIGFFNVPVVDDSVSGIAEYSMNCGNILCLAKDKYDDGTAGWLKYFVENIGNEAMEQFGAVKGYQYDVQGELSTYTQIVADELGKAESAFTWFEASMGSEISTTAQENVQTLVNGDMTAEEYMQSIQDAYDVSN